MSEIEYIPDVENEPNKVGLYISYADHLAAVKALEEQVERLDNEGTILSRALDCKNESVIELSKQLAAAEHRAEVYGSDLGVHLSHCNFGEHSGACKYGESDCPALSDSWSWFGNNLQKVAQMREALECAERCLYEMWGAPVPDDEHHEEDKAVAMVKAKIRAAKGLAI